MSTLWRTNVYAFTDLTFGGLWTGIKDYTTWNLLYIDYSTYPAQLEGSYHESSTLQHDQLSSSLQHAQLVPSSWPAQLVPSTCSARPFIMTSSARPFIVASSSHLNLIPRVLYGRSSRLNSTLGRTQSRQPIGGSGSQLNGPRMIKERPIKPTLWGL